MLRIILAWVGLFAVWCSFGQTVTVTDAQTGERMELVNISNQRATAYAVTNARGEAGLTEFSAQDTLSFTSLGYKAQKHTLRTLADLGYNVALEPGQLNLGEFVVSVTRWRQSTGNVPAKISLLSQKEISLQNPQTAADMLAITGKVFVQKSQQGGGSPMIRGFATNRLLYTVDGVRMNSAIFRAGNIQNVINIDPFSVERAEVVFGPGSVIYGSDAIGGVMGFQTLTPTLALSDDPLVTGKAVARYSSANNERTAHFDVNVGWRKWALVSSISHWNFDHLRQGSNGPDDYLKPYFVQRIDSTDRLVTQDDELLQTPSAYSQTNFMQKVRFRPSKQLDIVYGLHFSETSPYGRYDRHNRVRNGTARYAEWNYGPQRWVMHNLTATAAGNNAFFDEVSMRLAAQTFLESRIDRSLNDPIRNTQREEVQAYSANLDFTRRLGKRQVLYYGAEYILNNVFSSGEALNIATRESARIAPRYPRADWQSAAVYVNSEVHLNPRLTLQAGARYNVFDIDARFDTVLINLPYNTINLNNGALTGSLGAVWRPTERWAFSTNLGTAFRAPNVDDTGKLFDSVDGFVTVPNSNLGAEYAYSADVGIARIFADWLKLDVTGYFTLLDNALVRRNFILNGEDTIVFAGVPSQVQAIQNAAQATVWGVQAGVEIKLPRGFGFHADANFQQGEEELEDGSVSPSRHAPPFFGNARLTYSRGRLNMQVFAQMQGEFEADEMAFEERDKTEIYALDSQGRAYAPSWYTLNFKAQYQVGSSVLLGAGLENITDQRYRPYSSGISGAGRNFIISVRTTF